MKQTRFFSKSSTLKISDERSLKVTVKELRTDAGMTQKEFSDYFNIPRRSIEDWETEKRTPPEYLVKLIEYKLRAEGKINKEENNYGKSK